MAATYPIFYLTVGEVTKTYSDSQIIEAKISEKLGPLAVELPISTVTIDVLDESGDFNIFSGTLLQELSQRQPMMVYEQVDTEMVFMGKYYLDSWKNISEYQFQFKGIDALGVLDDIQFNGYFWEYLTPFADVIAVVLSGTGFSYEIESSLTTEIKGWIPPGTVREALQQACFAVGATVLTTRREDIYIFPTPLPILSDDFSSYLSDDDKMETQSLTILPVVTQIEVVAHDYSKGTTRETIMEKYLEIGEYLFVFDAPYYDILATGVGGYPAYLLTENSEFLITEGEDNIVANDEYYIGVNSIQLNVTVAGDFTITGIPWTDNQTSYTFDETGVSATNANVIKVTEATMISRGVVTDVLGRLRDYYRQRFRMDIEVPMTSGVGVLSSEAEYGDAVYGGFLYDEVVHGEPCAGGEVWKVDAMYGSALRVLPENIDIDLSGGYLAKIRIVGVENVAV